jgi:hypothetical protein
LRHGKEKEVLTRACPCHSPFASAQAVLSEQSNLFPPVRDFIGTISIN